MGINKNEQVNQLIQYIYDYDRLTFNKEDFQKRKRVKNFVPIFDRCCAKRANEEQCTRRKKDGCEYCGTHLKGTPHGIIDNQNEPKNNTQKIEHGTPLFLYSHSLVADDPRRDRCTPRVRRRSVQQVRRRRAVRLVLPDGDHDPLGRPKSVELLFFGLRRDRLRRDFGVGVVEVVREAAGGPPRARPAHEVAADSGAAPHCVEALLGGHGDVGVVRGNETARRGVVQKLPRGWQHHLPRGRE